MVCYTDATMHIYMIRIWFLHGTKFSDSSFNATSFYISCCSSCYPISYYMVYSTAKCTNLIHFVRSFVFVVALCLFLILGIYYLVLVSTCIKDHVMTRFHCEIKSIRNIHCIRFLCYFLLVPSIRLIFSFSLTHRINAYIDFVTIKYIFPYFTFKTLTAIIRID